LRDQDQALITGVNRDEPLALSAVVHKICQELPNCESDSRVKAVIDYFADSLGPACAKFNGADSDNAFVALLAIGNMGRMRGGVNSLVQCANNQRLQIVYRAFALHSLRRFSNFSTTDKHQLSNLLLDESQDAEVRIAAFQALARHGFSNPSMLRDYIRQLLDRTRRPSGSDVCLHSPKKPEGPGRSHHVPDSTERQDRHRAEEAKPP
ncbi:hypothetical protein BOX15_Mlig032554g1, partial [Macrostomum lignano]